MNDASKTYSRTWRPVPDQPRGGGRFARRIRVAVLAAALLAVSGALIAWIFFIRPFPKAHFMPLCIDEYGEGFPIRPWVRQDVEALRGLDWEEKKNAFTIQERELLVQELRDFTRREYDGPLVL